MMKIRQSQRILSTICILLCGFLWGFFLSPIQIHAMTDGIKMNPNTEKIYQSLKTECTRIAKGEKTSVINLKTRDFFDQETYTYEELGIPADTMTPDERNARVKEILRTKIKEQIEEALGRMKLDCPYELYWFDRESNVTISFSYVKNSSAIFFEEGDYVTITMTVAKDYQKNGISIKLDPDVIQRAQLAKETALSIVKKYANVSDSQKIRGYVQEIQNRTSYDEEAVTSNYHSRYGYGDAYQLLSVFDNDSSTSTVCEGYAKAFQYLCDLSHFQDARSYTVTGILYSRNTTGAHMWNLVRMQGQTYLVDATNADIASGDLILTGGVDLAVYESETESHSDQRYLLLNKDKQKMYYSYDDITIHFYDKELLKLPHLHIETEPVTENLVEATCTTPASYDTVIYCRYCREELSRASYHGTVGEHVYKNTTFPRTCECDGFKLHECIRCGYTYTNSVIPSYGGHSWNSGTKNADSTTTYRCLRCGQQKVEGKGIGGLQASSIPNSINNTNNNGNNSYNGNNGSNGNNSSNNVAGSNKNPVLATIPGNPASTGKNEVINITIRCKTSVKARKSLTAKAIVTTSTGQPVKVKWSVNKKKFAKINAKGKLTALKAGKGKKVILTATALDGSGVKASKVIRIK